MYSLIKNPIETTIEKKKLYWITMPCGKVYFKIDGWKSSARAHRIDCEICNKHKYK